MSGALLLSIGALGSTLSALLLSESGALLMPTRGRVNTARRTDTGTAVFLFVVSFFVANTGMRLFPSARGPCLLKVPPTVKLSNGPGMYRRRSMTCVVWNKGARGSVVRYACAYRATRVRRNFAGQGTVVGFVGAYRSRGRGAPCRNGGRSRRLECHGEVR